ncbi:MAG: hypothetical protein WCN98_02990 [Verrucomicrobiaceae bacterium]
MKIILPSAFIAAIAAFSLTGCASMGSSDTKSMLSAAGFVERTPETPKQKELYAAAQSYKVHQITSNGKTFYAYKDEKNGTAFVGTEANYQQYQRLAVQHQIAQEQYQAAAMQTQAAMGWYGAYGPYAFGPRIYGGYGRVGRYR